MKTKLLILSIYICGIANAQAPNWVWAKSLGNSDPQVATSIACDTSGNIYIAGIFSNPMIVGTTTLTSAGLYDIFLAKYDPSGNVIWAKSAGGAKNEGMINNVVDQKAISLSVNSSGDAFITGSFLSPTINFGSVNLTNADNTGNTADIFLAKYDYLGNLLWAKSAGQTATSEKAESIAADTSGNVYIAGFFNSSILIFDTTTLTNADASHEDMFLAKFDTSGNVLWAKREGSEDNDEANSIAVDAFGNVYVAGCFRGATLSFDSSTLTNATSCCTYDIFLTKYDAAGNVQWAKRAGGASSEFPISIAFDAAGNIFVAGIFDGTMYFGSISLYFAGYYDTFLAKYDASGSVLWAKRAGYADADVGYSVAADAAGNAYLTGSFSSPTIIFGATTLTNANNNGYLSDIFVTKYDVSGNEAWAIRVGGSSSESANSNVVDASGNIYVAGGFNSSTVSFGSTTLPSAGQQDVFLAKLDGSIVTEVNKLSNSSNISIFPNPTNGKFTTNSEEKISAIEIENVLGEKIYPSSINLNKSEIDLISQPNGVYFISIKTENGVINKKIIMNK